MKTTNLLTLGADVEVFLQETSTHAFIPSNTFFEYTKDEPLEAYGYQFSKDNVSFEFATPTATSGLEFVNYINEGLKLVRQYVPSNLTINYDVSSATFPQNQLTGENAIFGCDPDYSAYTGQMNFKPAVEDINPYRFAGGHIHLGYNEPNDQISREIAKALDIYLYIPFNYTYGYDKFRNSIYGMPGTHRLKPYGVEYRSLGPQWLNAPNWVYSQLEKAFDHVQSGKEVLTYEQVLEAARNKAYAEEVMRKYGV